MCAGKGHTTQDDLPPKDDTFVPNNHNTSNTLQTPSPTTRVRKFFLQLWGFFSLFRQHNVRYAIKATLASVAIASLAFIPATQVYFKEFRMEWCIITVGYTWVYSRSHGLCLYLYLYLYLER